MSAEATELVLFIDNDLPLYRQKEAIFRALARKKDRHSYQRARAPKAFAALTNTAAKKYVKEHGAPSDRWNLIFSPIHRRQAALLLVDHFEGWYEADYPALNVGAARGGGST